MTPGELGSRARRLSRLCSPLLVGPLLLSYAGTFMEQYVSHNVAEAWVWCGVFMVMFTVFALLKVPIRPRRPR